MENNPVKAKRIVKRDLLDTYVRHGRLVICSFLAAQYAVRTAIEIEAASPYAIAAKITTIMVTAVVGFTAANAMLRAIHMRCWRSAIQGAIDVGGAAIVIMAVKFLWVL